MYKIENKIKPVNVRPPYREYDWSKLPLKKLNQSNTILIEENVDPKVATNLKASLRIYFSQNNISCRLYIIGVVNNNLYIWKNKTEVLKPKFKILDKVPMKVTQKRTKYNFHLLPLNEMSSGQSIKLTNRVDPYKVYLVKTAIRVHLFKEGKIGDFIINTHNDDLYIWKR